MESLFKFDFGLSVFNYRYRQCKDSFSENMHSHNHIEIGHIVEGACSLKFEEESITFSKGETMVVYPDTWHYFKVDFPEGCTIVQLEFSIKNLSVLEFKQNPDDNLLFLYSLLNNSGRFLKITGNEKISDNMERFIGELDRTQKATSSLAKIYFFELFIHLSRQLKENKEFLPGNTDQHVLKALQYLHNNFLEDPGVETIASYCGISSRYLRKLFFQHTGMQIVDYKHNLRMKLALKLLKDKNLRITEIAYRCGYSTQQYFCKVFKDHYGIPPREKRHKITN